MKNRLNYLQLLLTFFLSIFSYLFNNSVLAQTQPLNLENPSDLIPAYRKIFCSLVDGEEVVFWWQGKVYSRVQGEKDRHLFNIEGMNIRSCGKVTNEAGVEGYRSVSREVMLYLDPKTNQLLTTWSNPFLERDVKVVHVANDPVNGKPRFPEGMKFNGIIKDETLMFNFVVPLFYQNPLGGNYQNFVGGNYHAMEMFNYFVSLPQLMDANNNFVADTNISWTRLSQWLPWMEMGDRNGMLIFSAVGKRLGGWQDLPDTIRKEIETNYPLYMSAPPLDDQRPNQTSWTNFKEYIDSQPSSTSP